MFPKLWNLMTKWVLHWLMMNFLGKISNIVHDVFAYWYNYSLFIMSPHHLFKNSINMSWNVKCMQQPQFKIKFCKKKQNIFSVTQILFPQHVQQILFPSLIPVLSRNILPFVIANVDGTLISMDTQVKLKKEIETGKVDWCMCLHQKLMENKRRVSSTTYIKSWKMWFRNRVIIFLMINIYITVMSYSLDINISHIYISSHILQTSTMLNLLSK